MSITRKVVDVNAISKAKKNDNSGIRTHALDGPAPEAGALDHSATLSLLLTLAALTAQMLGMLRNRFLRELFSSSQTF